LEALTGRKVTIEPGDPPCILVSGEINYESASEITRAFTDLRSQGHASVALDCMDVDFIDSSGIGSIAHAAQKLQDAGGGLILRAATGQLLHALKISGIAELLGLDLEQTESHVHPSSRVVPKPCRKCSFSIPVAKGTVPLARRRVAEFIGAMEFTSVQLDDIKLAVGEALANAVRHGCPSPAADCLTVRCTGDCDKVVISVCNPGEPFDADAVPIPIPENLREGGMGLFFMRTAMDEVSYQFDGSGTTVTMVKYVTPVTAGLPTRQ
jgi:serine/threonine-protein kinase RsbW